jgi:hypothetical protein
VTTSSDHIETALDQLRLAFDTSETPADLVLCFVAACYLHAAIATLRNLAAVQAPTRLEMEINR